jgi:MT0933-like antitoxin protein
MGLEDIVNQAKDLVSSTGQGDAVDGAVDQAAEAIKEKTPDQADGLVDQGAQAIKDQI